MKYFGEVRRKQHFSRFTGGGENILGYSTGSVAKVFYAYEGGAVKIFYHHISFQPAHPLAIIVDNSLNK